MELKVNICTNDSCKVVIQDYTTDYKKENYNSQDDKRPTFKKSTSVIIILKFTTQEDSIEKVIFIPHDNLKIITKEIPINFDGWFKVHYLVIPKEISPSTELLYYVGENNVVYKLVGGTISEATTLELIEVNNVTLNRYTQNDFSVCNLRKCYQDILNKIMNGNGTSKGFMGRCFENNIDKTDLFKRDVLLMALNSIKYLVEFCQFAEAQRLLERLVTCNGLCTNSLTNTKKHGCGCM